MLFVRPEMDIPVVPILTNLAIGPRRMPRPRRYFEVGKSDSPPPRQLADEQTHRRLVSGHLSLEVGARNSSAPPDRPNFDAAAVVWIVTAT